MDEYAGMGFGSPLAVDIDCARESRTDRSSDMHGLQKKTSCLIHLDTHECILFADLGLQACCIIYDFSSECTSQWVLGCWDQVQSCSEDFQNPERNKHEVRHWFHRSLFDPFVPESVP